MTGDITTITKAGNNTLHGTGFFNFNNDGLNANPNYFSKNIPNESDNKNYGASLSGPIIRDKTFFFLTYERLSIARTGVATATVPEADFRTGNFARLTTPILDPRTGQPFPGNVIPHQPDQPGERDAALDSTSPAPNEGLATRRYAIDATETSNQVDLRIDHNFRPGHTAFVRFSGKNLDSRQPHHPGGLRAAPIDEKPTRNLALLGQLGPDAVRPQRAALRLQHRRTSGSAPGLIGQDFVQDAGLQPHLAEPARGLGLQPLRHRRLHQLRREQGGAAHHPRHPVRRQRHLDRRAPHLQGRRRHPQLSLDEPAELHGRGRLRRVPVPRHPRRGHRQRAGQLPARPARTSVDQTATGPGVDGTATHYGFFVQDEWRASNKVTVNLGLRYDLYPGFDGRRAQHHQLPARHAQRRRGRAQRGLAADRQARLHERARDLAHPHRGGGGPARDAALHRQEQLRSAPGDRLAALRRQPHGGSRRVTGSTTRASWARSSTR